MSTNLDIPIKKTDLYPKTSQKVKKLDRDINDKLMAWKMFHTTKGMHVTNYYGKEISYKGIEYEGSPTLVFWNDFIEPFLENGIIDILNTIYHVCTKKTLPPQLYMEETCEILKLLNRKTYENMSVIDQRLKGKGYPKRVTPVKVNGKINNMNQFIDSHSMAILKRGNEAVAYDWNINNTREVFCNEKHIVRLPRLQYKLFECLCKKAGKYVKNETLEKCRGNDTVRYSKSLTDTMSKIRSKLKTGLAKNNIPVKGDVIEPKQENKKNVSYKLVT